MTMTMTHKLRLFQSTRPRGTRHIWLPCPPRCPSFNPRVRAGRDGVRYPSHRALVVSIHASARDATSRTRRSLSMPRFQSTRPRGTRRFHPCNFAIYFSFNPRVRAGRDPQRTEQQPRIMVSIHASARDAAGLSVCQIWYRLFQSTRPRGTRLRRQVRSHHLPGFQSTRPRGTRQPSPSI